MRRWTRGHGWEVMAGRGARRVGEDERNKKDREMEKKKEKKSRWDGMFKRKSTTHTERKNRVDRTVKGEKKKPVNNSRTHIQCLSKNWPLEYRYTRIFGFN